MTAQINDKVFHRRINYSIVGREGERLFKIQDHGIEPVAFSTACWSGYYCRYRIADERLCLSQVIVGLEGQQAREAELGRGPLFFGVAPRFSQEEGAFVFDLPDEPMHFTGSLTLASGFVRQLYSHAGFHPAWKFEEVRDLHFDQGRLATEQDRSAEMAELRSRNVKQNPRIPGFLESEEDHF